MKPVAFGMFSLVVPAHNESHRLPSSLRQMVRFFPRFANRWEVIVVDDGSADETATIVRQYSRRHPGIRLVRQPHRGKGAAVATGMLAARGRMVGFSDADLATPLRFLRPMVAAIDRGVDIAIGSRAILGARSFSQQSFLRQYLGHAFGWLTHQMLVANVADSQCGLKVFRQQVVRMLFGHLLCDGVLFDMEVMIRAAKKRLVIAEIPVEWSHHPETRLSYTPASSLQLLADVFRLRHRYGMLRPLQVKKA